MTIFKRCDGCHKQKFAYLVKRRPVHIPNIGMKAMSQLEICPKCANDVQVAINSQPLTHGVESVPKDI